MRVAAISMRCEIGRASFICYPCSPRSWKSRCFSASFGRHLELEAGVDAGRQARAGFFGTEGYADFWFSNESFASLVMPAYIRCSANVRIWCKGKAKAGSCSVVEKLEASWPALFPFQHLRSHLILAQHTQHECPCDYFVSQYCWKCHPSANMVLYRYPLSESLA